MDRLDWMTSTCANMDSSFEYEAFLKDAINKFHASTICGGTKNSNLGFEVGGLDGYQDGSANEMFPIYQDINHHRYSSQRNVVMSNGSSATVHNQHPARGFSTYPVSRTFSSRQYPCKMCTLVLDSKTEYQLHFQSHMREPKPYKCSQCPKCFANSSYLSQHMRIHLGIKPYHCEVCRKKFTQLSHLQQHLRTHTGDKPYKCPSLGCSKAFSQLSNLQSHSRSHQTDKPYKCNSCYKCFYDEASLLDHIPKHKDSKHLKTHICKFCGKSYTQETYLARHMAKHIDKIEKSQNRSHEPLIKSNGEVYFSGKQESPPDMMCRRTNQDDLMFSSYSYNGYSSHLKAHVNGHHSGSPHYDIMSQNGIATSSAFCVPNGRSSITYPYDSFNSKSHVQNGFDSKRANGHRIGCEQLSWFAGLDPVMPTLLDSGLLSRGNGNSFRNAIKEVC